MIQVVVRPHPGSVHLHLDDDGTSVSIDHSSKRKSYAVSSALPLATTQHQLFDEVMCPLLERWLSNGEHGAVFAYGFTGTGKSYSLFGTEENPGAIVQAAKYLLAQLPIITESMSTDGPCSLRVSIFEVDGKNVKDLLDESSLTVRVDEQGSVHLRRTDGKGPLTRLVLQTADDFHTIWDKAKTSRRVGSSTVHDASSRTHAIVDMEIVNPKIIELEEEIEKKNSEYIQISNSKDDILKEMIETAYKDDGPAAILDGVPIQALGSHLPTQEIIDKVKLAKEQDISVIDGVPLTVVMQAYGQPSETALEELREARRNLESYKQDSQEKIPAFLGSCSLIDMAGNDWEQAMTMQTKQAKKEHSDINTSLLAVKECFRAVQKKSRHVPYRRSHLTQILKRHFMSSVPPSSGPNSPTTSRTGNCVMLTTIYPKDEEVTRKQTMNTLLYASSIAK